MGCQSVTYDNVMLFNNNYRLGCSQHDNMFVDTANSLCLNGKCSIKPSNINFIQADITSSTIVGMMTII